MEEPPQSSRTRALVLGALLFVATCALYWRVGDFGFLNYDDDVYVEHNEAVAAGLTGKSVGWAFGTFHAGNWHPVTWLSHMLDVELFGLDAGAHHRTNVVLHASTAVLLLAALRALTGALLPSALVAAFFALHPLRVESVAWVSERKDLLAGLFFGAMLLAYAAHARRPGVLRMAAVTVLLGLGLLSKPMLVTAPFVLLLLDRWPLERRAPLRALLSEKVPLVLCSAASALVTLRAQAAGGTLDPLLELSFSSRAANAIEALGTYLAQTIWPSGLAVLYPHPALGRTEGANPWTAGVVASCLALLVLALLAYRTRRRLPWVVTGGLWFLGMLVPVLGLVQVGIQSHADRYTYLPSVGLWLAIVWTAARLSRSRPRARVALLLAGGLALVAYAVATHRQLGTWRSTTTVMQRAVDVTESNFMAHTNLGAALEADGRVDEAIPHYARALEIRPGVPAVSLLLAKALLARGRGSEAIEPYRAVLAAEPGYAEAAVTLGILLAQQGRDAEAVPYLRRVWDHPDASDRFRAAAGPTLAWILATSSDDGIRDGARALELARSCERLVGASALLETRAAAHAATGDFTKAVELQTTARESAHPAAAAEVERRLELYRAGEPYRRP